MTDSAKSLELNVVLARVADFASSERAYNIILSTVPSADIAETGEMLLLTNEGVFALTQLRFCGVETFSAIDEPIQKAQAGGKLTMRELLSVSGVLSTARVAKNMLVTYPQTISKLVDMGGRMYTNEPLEKNIRSKIISENEISDNASPQLRDIRIKIRTVKSRLQEKLGSFMRGNTYSKFLQDNLYTVRNGRYVLPVKSEYRSDVRGLLHDQSASGATVYIEPFEIVETNNEIIKLEVDEQREIERILDELSTEVSANSYGISICQEQITILDIIFAKAAYSIETDGTLPIVNFAKRINLIGARHPLIERNKVVAVNISVGIDANVLLISGPNTGGKTASLKTVGLMSLMAACGLFLPCKEGSEIAIFDRIFCDIGDMQDIQQSLSTFSSHIKNLIEITGSFTNESLILLDEIGSCTDPQEGSAIAVGVLEYISGTKAKAVVTTHYPQLKDFAMSSRNITNAGMQFDAVSLKPTFKLLMGYPSSSNAIETAAALGLSPEIIESANKHLKYDNEKNYEFLLKEAGLLKAKAESELAEIVAAKREYEEKLEAISQQERRISETFAKINSNAKAETRRLVNNAMASVNELVDEAKEKLKNENEQAILDAKRLLKMIDNAAYEPSEEPLSVLFEELDIDKLSIGQLVAIRSLGIQGEITMLKNEKQEAEVSVGGKKIKVSYKDLAEPISVSKPSPRPRKTNSKGSAPNAQISNYEINLIGKNVDEALELLDPILKSAKDMNVATLRIVHGKGTGALGKGIQRALRDYSTIKSFRYGRFGEGDNGVTIVEIK